MVDRGGAAGALAAHWGNQIGGTFLAVGSTLSLPALALTLAIMIAVAVRGRGRRPVRLRVLRRALLPRRIVRSRSGRLDIVFLAYSLLGAGLFGWAIVAADRVRGLAGEGLHGLFGGAPAVAMPGWPGRIAATLMLFAAYEFAYWLDHWLKHRVAVLWMFHRVHHSAEQLSLLTNFRVHPVDTILFYNLIALVTGVAAALVEAVSGARADIVAIGGTSVVTMAFAIGVTHLQHSHLWITYGRWGRHILSPAHHQIHHSADPRHHNRNFGNVLTWFDRAFGTHAAPSRARDVQAFGVPEIAYDPHGAANAFLRPFHDAAGLYQPRREDVGAGLRVGHTT